MTAVEARAFSRAALWEWRDRAVAGGGGALLSVASRLPPWLQVLLVFSATRVLVAVVLLNARGTGGRGQGYLATVDLWDGWWYRSIVEDGYPDGLPVTADGAVPQNAWAFFPLFPALTRVLVSTTGWDFAIAAAVLNLACGAVAVVLVRSVLEEVAGRGPAFWATTFLCCAPAAPVLQFAYSESVALLLVAAFLRALQRGHLLTASVLVVAAGLARPVGIPLAFTAGVHAVRLLRTADGDRRSARRDAGALLVAGACAVLCWPAVVAVRTGVVGGFLASQFAWRTDEWSVPGGIWLPTARGLLGDITGTAAVVLAAAVLATLLTGPRLRGLGQDLWVWTVAYVAYLWPATTFVSCLPRFLLLAFPLLVLLAPRRGTTAQALLITAVLLMAQLLWLKNVWPYPPLRHPGPP